LNSLDGVNGHLGRDRLHAFTAATAEGDGRRQTVMLSDARRLGWIALHSDGLVSGEPVFRTNCAEQ